MAGWTSLLEQIIHCKNYQQMTQQPHYSEHTVFMNSPAQTVMYIQRTLKKYGNKTLSFWFWSMHGTCEADVIACSKIDGTHAETRFGLSAKRTSPFKLAGVSVQSTTGSQGMRMSGQQLHRPCYDVQRKTTGYPLHSHLSPSIPLPCITVCHQVLNALYTPDLNIVTTTNLAFGPQW